ncbi:uncharacterized protein [Dermacentor andersoni]|uniref:uncharacterized protein n=1 Tax=Dermacentor andersoni TaxID=34620 RepID=UPI002415FD74|nr:uncharacterized protein LOC129382436 [Dermacentor andersoni]
MIGTLQNNADVLRMLSVFLIWNTGSTLFCYVGHIAASKFSSKYKRIEKLDADIDEDSYRACVLYGIYTFYVECKQARAMPTVVDRATFLNRDGGGTSEGQEPVIVVIRQLSAASADPVTAGRSLTAVASPVANAPMTFPGTSTASKTEAPDHPAEGKREPAEEKPRNWSSEGSAFGASHRQSQPSLELPEVVFPAIRPQGGLVPGPSKLWRGGAR